MATATLQGFLQRLRRAMAAETLSNLSDSALIDRFLATHEEAAFQAILQRHGPMVFRVCRRALSETQDVEDAFQATFLALASQARAIRNRASLASWLHGAAHRVALDARKRRDRRRKHETVAAASQRAAASPDDIAWKELRAVLDAELVRLPERLRAPLVLCYLEGLTHDEAAARLGQVKITFRRNLERGRDLLRARLTRRGLALSAALSGLLLSECSAPAAVSSALKATTTQAAAALAAGKAVASVASARALLLAQRFLPSLIPGKAKFAGVLLLAVLGAGVVTHARSVDPQPAVVAKEQIPAGAPNAGAAAVPEPSRKLECKVPCLILETEVQLEVNLRPDQHDQIVAVVKEADRPHAQDLAVLREHAERQQSWRGPGCPPRLRIENHPCSARRKWPASSEWVRCGSGRSAPTSLCRQKSRPPGEGPWARPCPEF